MTKLESAANEFLAGVTTRSPRVFLTSLVVGVIFLALIEAGLSKGLLWRLDPGWLLSNPWDDWTNAMWSVNQLDADDAITPIYLVGGSGSREAVISNESVEQALADKRPGQHRFLNLGTRNQTFFETVILVENLPDTKSGLIIFGLTPHFFTDGVGDAREAVYGTRFPLYSQTLVDALDAMGLLRHRALPMNILRYRAIFSNYLNQRIASRTLFEKIPYRNHLYAGLPPMPNAELADKFKSIAASMVDYGDNAALNFEMLKIAIRLAQRKGYTVLLIELPRNPVGEEFLYGRILDSYRKNLKTLTGVTGAEHIDLHTDYRFPRTYFYDHLHQIDKARIIFQKRLVDLISRQLESL